jgi:hypothetical protein
LPTYSVTASQSAIAVSAWTTSLVEHAEARRAVLGQDQEGDANGQEHRQAAHRRGPRLAVVPGRPLLADVLTELLQPQVVDEARPQEHADEQGGHAPDQDLAHR